MSTDHNRTPVGKPQVEGAPQECCESVCHCFRNRDCGEDLNEGNTTIARQGALHLRVREHMPPSPLSDRKRETRAMFRSRGVNNLGPRDANPIRGNPTMHRMTVI